MKEPRTEIGISEMKFDAKGKIISGKFMPKIEVTADADLLFNFNNLKVETPVPIRVRNAGETLLAKFFSKVTDIELADRGQYYIDSEMLECEKYKNGTTKKCVIKFFLNTKN